MQESGDQQDARPVEPGERHADAVEIVDERVLENAQQQNPEHAADQPADGSGEGGFAEQHPDDLRAASADRLEQAELAAPLGDDRREQHPDHQRRAREHDDREAEHAVEEDREPLPDRGQHGFVRNHLDVGKVGEDCEPDLLAGRAGGELDEHARQPAGLERCFLPADLLHDGSQVVEGRKGDEEPALVSADRGFAELAVDGQRLAEDEDLRAERFLAAAADDDVARAQRPVEAGVEPGLHCEVARGIEGDDVDRLVRRAITGSFCAEDELRGDAADAFHAREPPEHGVVEGRARSAPR